MSFIKSNMLFCKLPIFSKNELKTTAILFLPDTERESDGRFRVVFIEPTEFC